MDTITGQITYRRAVSKKLVFYDICCTGAPYSDSSAAKNHDDCERCWIEVVVKLGTYGSSIQDIKDLRDKVKLGDIVSVTGTFETIHVMQAASVTILEAWKDQHPATAFTPQPSPLHHRAKSEQQPHQQQQYGHTGAEAVEPDCTVAAAQQAAASTAGDGALAGQLHLPGAAAAAEPAAAATAARAIVQQPQLPVCKFWVNTGRCAKGAACPYAHLADGRTTWVKRRRGERQLLSSHLGFSHDADSAAAKGKRAQLFAAWLVDTFGKEALNAGCGVLDIAGGAGGMTYELSVAYGIKCTLVDPRPLKLNKQQHKQLKAAAKTAWLQLWIAEQLQQGNLAPELKQLKQQQQQEQEVPQEQLRHGVHVEPPPQQQPAHTQQPLALEMESTQDKLQPSQAVQQECRSCQPPGVQFHQVQGWFGPELWRSSAFQQLLGSSSLVLGLHPDEATEPIVDYALEFGRSFAVMPCCVFPRLFPNRRIERDGQLQHVESYADLVEYLTVKGQGKQEVLGFVGANVVVYRHA